MKYKDYSVYSHTSPSGKVYIGITKQRPTARWSNGKGYKENRHFTNAIIKYGWDNFTHRVLYTGLTKEEAEETEIRLIAKGKCTDTRFGYNRDLGGKLHSEETAQKLSEARKGENAYWYGKKHDDAYKKMMSDACKGMAGHPMTPHHKELLRQLSIGRKWTDEQRRKIMEGRAKYYAEHKVEKKPNQPKPIKYVCEIDGIKFKSGAECAEYVGICPQQLNAYLRGARLMPQKYADRGLRFIDKDIDYLVSDGHKDGRPGNIIVANGIEYKSQAKCAKALGVSCTTLSGYLKGERPSKTLDNISLEIRRVR